MVYTINYIGVLLSAVGSFAIGFLWFGPIFGKTWMKLMNFSLEQMEEGKKKGMVKPMLLSLISCFVTAFIFFTLAEATFIIGFSEALCLAVLIWLGFSAPIFLNSVLWDGKSWKLFWLNSLHILATLVLSAFIFSLMGV